MFLESRQLLDWEPSSSDAATARAPAASRTAPSYGVDNEYGRLGAVLLADPGHLALVPCNSVSNENARRGLAPKPDRAARQHKALASLLRQQGVEVLLAPAAPGLPDLAFVRDTSLMTPWGLIGLRPGAPHRGGEVGAVLACAASAGVPVLGRIEQGRVEGGDVAILRPGLVLIGISGERTDEAGAEALGRMFRRKGWTVMTYRFDPHFLHLDTLFCLADRNLGLACTDALEDAFIGRLERLGIDLVPVAYKQARRLGCNLLALGGRRVVTAEGCAPLDAELQRRGYRAIPVNLSEFTMCGGGVHCLTMPLRRAAG
jgi:N-dimethylarginine dimethylaminohydrolase